MPPRISSVSSSLPSTSPLPSNLSSQRVDEAEMDFLVEYDFLEDTELKAPKDQKKDTLQGILDSIADEIAKRHLIWMDLEKKIIDLNNVIKEEGATDKINLELYKIQSELLQKKTELGDLQINNRLNLLKNQRKKERKSLRDAILKCPNQASSSRIATLTAEIRRIRDFQKTHRTSELYKAEEYICNVGNTILSSAKKVGEIALIKATKVGDYAIEQTKEKVNQFAEIYLNYNNFSSTSSHSEPS